MIKNLFLLLLIGLFSSCGFKEPVKRRFFRMDTVTDIIIYDGKYGFQGNHVNRVIAQIDSLLLDWDNRFSAEKSGSEVFEINNRTSDTVSVSPELYDMVDVAQWYAGKLNGAFDITVLPLKQFWNPGCSDCSEPDPASDSIRPVVDSIVAIIGFEGVTLLDQNRVAFSHRELKIDLGGIAKGRVIRELRDFLVKRGMTDFLISAGGDILVHGKKPDNSAFRVGVQHPRGDSLAALFEMSDGAVVTSGDYERYRIAGSGTRVHHLFDSETGYPSMYNSSVTVTGEDPVDVDILSTALFTWQSDSAIAYIESKGGFECMIITQDGKKMYSSGFKNQLK